MRATIACLCFALLFRGLFDASVKAAPDEGDLDQAARNLYESTTDSAQSVWWAYADNPDLPADAVEVEWYEDVQEGILYQEPPLTRPSDVPDNMVLTRLFQMRGEGEVWTYRFLGWLYMKPADVSDLHRRLVKL